MKKVLFIAGLLFWVGLIKGQIITDRPDQTEASSTVAPGTLQIESGFTFQTEDIFLSMGNGLVANKQETQALPNTLIRLGVINRLELRVVTQPELQRTLSDGEVVERNFGIADLQLGFKVNILEDREGRPEVGFLSHLILPTGTKGIGIPANTYGVVNRLLVTHALNERMNLAYNLGYDYISSSERYAFVSLSWATALTEKVGVYIEPYVSLDEWEWEVNADAGFTYLVNDDFQLDYSFGTGLTQGMNYHSLGASIRIPK